MVSSGSVLPQTRHVCSWQLDGHDFSGAARRSGFLLVQYFLFLKFSIPKIIWDNNHIIWLFSQWQRLPLFPLTTLSVDFICICFPNKWLCYNQSYKSWLGHLLTSTNLEHFWFLKCFPVDPKQSLLGDFQNTFHSLIIAFRTFHLKAYLLVHIVSLFALKVLGGSFRKL